MKINWTSPENNLPKAEKEVLLLCQTKYGNYKCVGFFEPEGNQIKKSNYHWGCICCDEYVEPDNNTIIEFGWYELNYNLEHSPVKIEDKILGWIYMEDEVDE